MYVFHFIVYKFESPPVRPIVVLFVVQSVYLFGYNRHQSHQTLGSPGYAYDAYEGVIRTSMFCTCTKVHHSVWFWDPPQLLLLALTYYCQIIGYRLVTTTCTVYCKQ